MLDPGPCWDQAWFYEFHESKSNTDQLHHSSWRTATSHYARRWTERTKFWSSSWNDISLARGCTCGRCTRERKIRNSGTCFADLAGEKNGRCIVEPDRRQGIEIVNFLPLPSISCTRARKRASLSTPREKSVRAFTGQIRVIDSLRALNVEIIIRSSEFCWKPSTRSLPF